MSNICIDEYIRTAIESINTLKGMTDSLDDSEFIYSVLKRNITRIAVEVFNCEPSTSNIIQMVKMITETVEGKGRLILEYDSEYQCRYFLGGLRGYGINRVINKDNLAEVFSVYEDTRIASSDTYFAVSGRLTRMAKDIIGD